MPGEVLLYAVPVLVVVCLLAVGVASLGRQELADGGDLPEGALLRPGELTLFAALQDAAGEDYLLLAKVSSRSLLKKRSPPGGRTPASVDFLLCDPETTEALLAIELLRRRTPRLGKLCQHLDLPLLTVAKAKQYDPEQLAERIGVALEPEEDEEAEEDADEDEGAT